MIKQFEELTSWVLKQKYSSAIIKQALPETYKHMLSLFNQLDKLFMEGNIRAFLETIKHFKTIYTESCNAIDKAINILKNSSSDSSSETSEDLLLF
jgi:hypothetical protein